MDVGVDGGSCTELLTDADLARVHADRAVARIDELKPVVHAVYAPIADVCRILTAAERADEACRIAAHDGRVPPRVAHGLASAQAIVAEADGDAETAARLYAEAAYNWRSFGDGFEHAHALAGQGRTLAVLGRSGAAGELQREAGAVFARLGVRHVVATAPGRAALARGSLHADPSRPRLSFG